MSLSSLKREPEGRIQERERGHKGLEREILDRDTDEWLETHDFKGQKERSYREIFKDREGQVQRR